MNPVLKRTLTGISIGLGVIAAALLAPPAAIVPVIALLAFLAVVEFGVLLRRKRPRWTVGTALGFLLGAALIAGGLGMLALVSTRYGEATCGGVWAVRSRKAFCWLALLEPVRLCWRNQ